MTWRLGSNTGTTVQTDSLTASLTGYPAIAGVVFHASVRPAFRIRMVNLADTVQTDTTGATLVDTLVVKVYDPVTGLGVQGIPISWATQAPTSSDGFAINSVDTAVKYKVPLITIVYNNDCWGTWTFGAGSPRGMHIHLFQEGIRYDRMAEALGAHGAYVKTPEELRAALTRSFDVATREGIPSLINVQAKKEFSSARDYPPGGGMGSEPGISGFQH